VGNGIGQIYGNYCDPSCEERLKIISPIHSPHSTGFTLTQPIQLGHPLQSDISLLHQHQTIAKMKTTITILAAVLTLSASVLFAGNETSSAPVSNDNATITMAVLAPVAPAEATFEDFTTVNEIAALVPVTPSEATFEDVSTDMISTIDLSPVTPSQADFEDIVADVTIDNGTLTPVTPAIADFE
jgi:hypothetical protein